MVQFIQGERAVMVISVDQLLVMIHKEYWDLGGLALKQ